MANVVATTIEGLGMFAGRRLPVSCSQCRARGHFVVMAVDLWSALLVLPIRRPRRSRARRIPLAGEFLRRLRCDMAHARPATAHRCSVRPGADCRLHQRAGRRHRTRPARAGGGGVGLLDAAVGLGALLGALVIVAVGRARLTAPLLVGALLWGCRSSPSPPGRTLASPSSRSRSSASATRSWTWPDSRCCSGSLPRTCWRACSASWKRSFISPSASARCWRRCSWRRPVPVDAGDRGPVPAGGRRSPCAADHGHRRRGRRTAA